MKEMLIIGGSKGIGLECKNYFKNRYNVTTVARTNADINIDITIKDNREFLINTQHPSILVYTAGELSNDVNYSIENNLKAVIHLIDGFFKKKTVEHIFYLGSTRDTENGFEDLWEERAWYAISKKASAHFIEILKNWRTETKTTIIRLGKVNTGFGSKKLSVDEINNLKKLKQRTPIDIHIIPQYIDAISKLPFHINITDITIDNHYKGNI